MSAELKTQKISKEAVFLAAACYQANKLYEKKELTLPQAFQKVAILYAMSGTLKPKEGIFGFIAESNKEIVIAFRGTHTLRDWTSDLDILQIAFPFAPAAGKVHRGFINIYSGQLKGNSAREQILATINKLNPKKKLYITGHSLGGALATLCALDIAVNTKFKQPRVYTYASARVGNRQFVRTFNRLIKQSIRIANIHDLITVNPQEEYKAPFIKKGLFYDHVKGYLPLNFQFYNPLLNHLISSYYCNLSLFQATYSQSLAAKNPNFCPRCILPKKGL